MVSFAICLFFLKEIPLFHQEVLQKMRSKTVLVSQLMRQYCLMHTISNGLLN